jgi:hypothetical protein
MTHRIARLFAAVFLLVLVGGTAPAGATTPGPRLIIAGASAPNAPAKPGGNKRVILIRPATSKVRQPLLGSSATAAKRPSGRPLVVHPPSAAAHAKVSAATPATKGAATRAARSHHALILGLPAASASHHAPATIAAKPAGQQRPVLPAIPWSWLVPGLALGLAGIVMASLRRPKHALSS